MTREERRCILITGCSSGIGRTCALGMMARGWRVFATARREEDIEALKDMGLDALYLDYDEPESIAACVSDVLRLSGGRLDALFNNGAYGQPGAVEDLSREVLRRQFETNVFGWHDLTRQVIPVMRAQGHGRIVNNSSVLGLVAMKWRGAYNASKFAIEGLTDTLRLELRGSGIFVSLIEPGPIFSKFTETALRHFRENIDIEHSYWRTYYKKRMQTLKGEGRPNPFKLPPEAVLKKLVHAVESPRPKPRYYVTVPTHVMAMLKRLLPTRWLDALLDRASDRT
ncbi:SDR family oxidoreductase [Thermopetrobacter sp. TC1]|uniref:SDR family oxidoreductase n=1 Tax=Thermopetrobacter sp. TC1 TaxID=1495045 RepID=UPI00056F2649|nr:SDR family oxidoreductase [Thermopetrobacter sp. TC1]